jgi:hypothetical protein
VILGAGFGRFSKTNPLFPVSLCPGHEAISFKKQEAG